MFNRNASISEDEESVLNLEISTHRNSYTYDNTGSGNNFTDDGEDDPGSSRSTRINSSSRHREKNNGSPTPGWGIVRKRKIGYTNIENSPEDRPRQNSLLGKRVSDWLSSLKGGQANGDVTRHHSECCFNQDPQFGPIYDTSSPAYLEKVFTLLDTNKNGVLTSEELRAGLATLETHSELSYIVLQSFLMGAFDIGSGGITMSQFVQTVQDTTSRMYKNDIDPETTATVWDYSVHSYSCQSLQCKRRAAPVGGERALTIEEFLSQPQTTHKVQWVNVSGIEPNVMIRLAHKYGIHPLQVEDALNPGKERLKVDVGVEGVMHVLLAKVKLKPREGDKDFGIDGIEREQISILLVDNGNTVIYLERTRSHLAEQIEARIRCAGSKLRLSDARFLVYAIADAAVDEIFPVIDQAQKWLLELQTRVHNQGQTPLKVVKAVQQVNRDMNTLQFYLRPMKLVVAQLVQDLPAGDNDLRRHLEDLLDHVVVLEEQAQRMVVWSRSLNGDYLNEQQYKMNKVVYFLTMVTSAFMPGQFLTGVFGMNFRYMPELQWRYSYLMFWCLIMMLVITVYNFYRRMNWL